MKICLANVLNQVLLTFYFPGEPGVGKTSSMASLALNWTDNHGKIKVYYNINHSDKVAVITISPTI